MDREELARVLDPYSFASWDGMVKHCLGAGDRQEDAERWATMTYGQNMDAAREKAGAVLAYFREYLGREQTVEAVARVICSTSLDGGDPDSKNGMGEPIWTEWKPDARAALAALSPKVQEGE